MRAIKETDLPRLMSEENKTVLLNLIYQQYMQNSHAIEQRSERANRITRQMSNVAAAIPISDQSDPTQPRKLT
jgi:hypothetical protein